MNEPLVSRRQILSSAAQAFVLHRTADDCPYPLCTDARVAWQQELARLNQQHMRTPARGHFATARSYAQGERP
jgi:hypothetical protein